jgi:protein phosphatase
VVGDLHGQLRDLLQIFEIKGLPSRTNHFLFNGDFVDRGTYSAEIVLILFAFKILYPDFIHLNRGNHEAADINSRDGFEKECILKWDAEVFRAFSEVFSYLPLAYIVSNQLFVVHGGLSWTDFLISDVEEADRFHEVLPRDSLVEDILWSDPSNRPGRFPSDRGAGCFFGRDVCEEFLNSNKLSLIVRSHECVDEGWESFFGGKLYTVFSASNYCGVTENKGAILVFQGSTFPRVKAVQFYSKSKELLRPINLPNVPIVVQDVVCRLGDVLMKNHEELRAYWVKVQEAAGKKDTIISKIQWTAGLVEVIKVQVPWLTVSKYLPGVKESISADGKTIDYDKFLLSYSPYQLFKKRMQASKAESGAPKAPKSEDPRVEEAMDKIYTAIYKNRYQLESLFRWFDEDGSGCLSLQEFIHGIRCLESLGLFPMGADGKGIPDEIIALVVDKIDSNHDGEVAYDEVRLSSQSCFLT